MEIFSTKLIKKIKHAPTSVFETNFSFFLPLEKQLQNYERTKERVVYDDGCYLKISTIGERLTQTHRNIFDAILYSGRTEFFEDNFEPIKIITLDEILRILGHKKIWNKKWLLAKIREMTLTRVILCFYENPSKKTEFSFIREFEHEEKDGNVEYILSFHPKYLNFLTNTFTHGYRDFLPDILALEHATTQAIVRYCLSFSGSTRITMERILKILGLECGEQSMQRHARLVFHELTKKGHIFGIELLRNPKKREKDYLSYTIDYSRGRAEIENKKISIHSYEDAEKNIQKRKNILDEAQKTA